MSFLEILSVHLYKQIILFLLETYIKHLKQSLKKIVVFFPLQIMGMKSKICLTYLTITHLKGLCSEATCLKKNLLEDCETNRAHGDHKMKRLPLKSGMGDNSQVEDSPGSAWG